MGRSNNKFKCSIIFPAVNHSISLLFYKSDMSINILFINIWKLSSNPLLPSHILFQLVLSRRWYNMCNPSAAKAGISTTISRRTETNFMAIDTPLWSTSLAYKEDSMFYLIFSIIRDIKPKEIISHFYCSNVNICW